MSQKTRVLLDRRTLLSGSAATLGALGLSGCAGAARTTTSAGVIPDRAILDRPIVDVHAHIFVASDLPGYQFIVQSFLAHHDLESKPSKDLLTVLHAFADAVTDSAPNFDKESDFLAMSVRPAPNLKEVLAKTFHRIGDGTYRPKADRLCIAHLQPSPLESQQTFHRLRAVLAPGSDVRSASEVMAELIAKGFDAHGFASDVAQRIAAAIESDWKLLKNALEWLRGFMKSRLDRVDDWASFMKGTQADAPRFVMPALVDFGYSLAGQDQPPTSFGEQVELMALISHRQPPNRLMHGYVPFNPWRGALQSGQAGPDPLALVKHAINDCGFIGVKLYPPMGFQASGNASIQPDEFKLSTDYANCSKLGNFPEEVDKQLFALYAYCEKNDVPIMLHSAPSNEAQEGWEDRVDPQFWWSVLEKHPKLRVNFGHFGGGFSLKNKPKGKQYIRSIVAMMARFPNVYADLGDYSLVLEGAGERELKELFTQEIKHWSRVYGNKILRNRLMFGTDWTFIARVPGHEAYPPALLLYMTDEIGFATAALPSGNAERAAERREITSAFAAGNASRFLGFNDSQGKVLPRLLRFYGKAAPEHVETLMAFVEISRYNSLQLSMRT